MFVEYKGLQKENRIFWASFAYKGETDYCNIEAASPGQSEEPPEIWADGQDPESTGDVKHHGR